MTKKQTFIICVQALVLTWLPSCAFAADQPDDAPELFPGHVRLILPPAIYAVPGIEMNLYFDNVTLVLNPANYAFDVTCEKGLQFNERWTFTPKAEDIGQFPFVLEVRDQSNAVIARAASTIHVIPEDAGKNLQKTLLCIGDSLTAASVYTQHICELAQKPDNTQITLIGSHGPNGQPGPLNRHEGYGGWRASTFATKFTGTARSGPLRSRKCGSPFIYKKGENPPKLDFARYCDEYNNGNSPDFVTIFLGCNDTFSGTDENIEKLIDSMLTHYDTLIKTIHDHNPDTIIGAVLIVPPAASQDAFGANYKTGQTRWQYKRDQHRVVERMIQKYGGRQNQNLFLIPAYINIDTLNNYPRYGLYPANAYTDRKLERMRNGVHPADTGYQQIGDTIFCWIKAQIMSQN